MYQWKNYKFTFELVNQKSIIVHQELLVNHLSLTHDLDKILR